jgi:hypothetical protein
MAGESRAIDQSNPHFAEQPVFAAVVKKPDR